MHYWLMKSEPDTFGIDHLITRPGQTEHWDGVRNYQARNTMRDAMQVGDLAFFYHSNCKEPGIVGIMTVTRAGYPDFSAVDSNSRYFDPKSSPERPRWFMVDVQLVRKLSHTIPLKVLKTYPELTGMPLLQRGNRLSIMPVEARHWMLILALEKREVSVNAHS